MNIIDEKLIDAFVVLVLANKYILREEERTQLNQILVPEKFINDIEIKVAERTIEVLSDGL